MAATIQFTDGTGSATVTALAGRLNNWSPDSLPVDDHATRLGSGVVDTFEFRANARVSFELRIANTDMAAALRLMKHLWRGGTCTVNTGDLTTPTSLSYSDMGIGTEADGARIQPTLAPHDRQTLDYDLTLTLQYVGNSTVPDLVVLY
jgi:hypothetical protein